MTKHGFPLGPRTSRSEREFAPKYCNMSRYVKRDRVSLSLVRLHEMNVRRYGMSVSDRSALEAANMAMKQPLARK